MKLGNRVIELIQKGAEVEALETPPFQGDKIQYYVIECSGVHIAIWPYWTIVNGKNIKRRFYLFGNPAYKYIQSYKYELDIARNNMTRINRRRRERQ